MPRPPSPARRAASPKGRRFYNIPSREPREEEEPGAPVGADLAEQIRDGLVGGGARPACFRGPFGLRPLVYCDYVASGRSLSFVEQFLREEVLPFYGNTHTTTTVTSLQTTLFRHEARDIFRNAVNASEHDAVIFTSSGCTGAIHKLIHGLRLPSAPVVFASAMEHHSNLLPWREIGSELVTIPENPDDGRLDLNFLARKLREHNSGKSRRPLIGCFCAASNVTGVLNDDLAITALLHQHGALAFWDYATAAPYVNIDMNPKAAEDTDDLLSKDAIFFSGHKFVGGVQTPGVLVAKKRLFSNPAPVLGGGGGSVFFVTGTDHRYLRDPEVREEAGTPAIVESIRAGMCMQLKQAAGAEYIMRREEQLMRRAKVALAGSLNLKSASSADAAASFSAGNLKLLGNARLPGRLPILSFVIGHPGGGYLHHNFVCALLNDLFGIQARGGCACAGPYAQDLLGIDPELAKEYERVLVEDQRLDRTHLRRGQAEYSQFEVLRPGFTRLNLSWFSSDEEVDFVLSALQMVASEGWKLLPQYRFNNETGDWKHYSNLEYKERKWLGNISYCQGKFSFKDKYKREEAEEEEVDFAGILEQAKQILAQSAKAAQKTAVPDQRLLFEHDDDVRRLRWFLLPVEAKELLLNGSASPPPTPFVPKTYANADANMDSDAANDFPGSYAGRPAMTADLRSVLAQGRRVERLSWPLEKHDSGADPAGPKPAKTSAVNSAADDVESAGQVDAAALKSARTTASKPGRADAEIAAVSEAVGRLAVENADKMHPSGAADCSDGLCVLTKERAPLPSPDPEKPRALWRVPSKDLFRPFLEAVEDFGMVENGDRVLVCLSGGKDSLTLLHTMRQYQFYARKNGINFDLGAVTVDPLSSAYDPRPLIPYLAELGVPYLYEQQAIMEQAQAADCSSICAFCSRMKRGRIYASARQNKYNVLAMGQHLDDLAESFLMSVFHNGRLRTMKANYTVKEGDLRVIRPLAYVREKQLRDFAKQQKLPVIPENCPACFESPKERHRTKQLLAQQELLFPRLYWSLKSAMAPVMSVSRTGVESVLFGRGTRRASGDDVAGGDGDGDDDDV